eukprot:m.161632 g.161632  ORF g.161632 m.161632 type:complete len:188 (+) comp38820_c0_seq5:185-748(+)
MDPGYDLELSKAHSLFCQAASQPSPERELGLYNGCLYICNKIAPFMPEARCLQRDASFRMARAYFALRDWENVIKHSSRGLDWPHFDQLALICLSMRSGAYENLKMHELAYNDCFFICQVYPLDENFRQRLKKIKDRLERVERRVSMTAVETGKDVLKRDNPKENILNSFQSQSQLAFTYKQNKCQR